MVNKTSPEGVECFIFYPSFHNALLDP